VLLPAANTPAQEDVCEGEQIRIRPTILIEKGGLMFINGARTLAENIPIWLGHDATDCEMDDTRTWTELVIESDSTVAITVPYTTSTCCKEVFISHSELDKHLSVAHSDAFRRYVCALCMRSRARYRQIAVHYAFCLRSNRKEAVASTPSTLDGPEASLCDTNPYISLAAESSPEDTEEGDLSQRAIPVTKPTFECKECDRSFPTKIGLSQHERYKHPNLRNANRIADQEKDIERKRKARSDSKKLTEETGTTSKPKKSLWTEVEIELLVQLEVELSGARFINMAIAERMPGKTNKQISDKRKSLKSQVTSKARTKKVQNPTPTLVQDTTVVQSEPTIPREDMFNNAICNSGLECVGMSAELLKLSKAKT
jgi:hypothetical protein